MGFDYIQVKYIIPLKNRTNSVCILGSRITYLNLLFPYRETLLLFDEKMSAITNKESIASVMAHELAHQWFGNIVTMKWWTDLWLNEGRFESNSNQI